MEVTPDVFRLALGAAAAATRAARSGRAERVRNGGTWGGCRGRRWSAAWPWVWRSGAPESPCGDLELDDAEYDCPAEHHSARACPWRLQGAGGGPFGARAGIGGLGRVVHGRVHHRTASGGYQTVEVQTGKVTSVSPTSISVTSADGYNHTYVVAASTVVDSQRDGISSVAKGDQVQVTATTVNGKDTVTNIVDTTKVGASRKGFGFGFGPRARPAPPASGSAPAGPPATAAAAVAAD